MSRRAAMIAIGLALLGGAPRSAGASGFLKIREIYPGATATPDTAYVMLQMYVANQTQVAGQKIFFYDATGLPISGATFTFPGNVGSGVDQAVILVGESGVAAAFGVTPDFTATLTIPPTGGKICFEALDCVSWGNYSGETGGVCSSSQPPDCSPAAPGGIPDGQALRRSIDPGDPQKLDPSDDTDVSADDFQLGAPNPSNNGIVPTATTTTTTSTTTPGGSGTTSTTLVCNAVGIGGARCVLSDLPPSTCEGRIPRRIPRLAGAAKRLLDRAENAKSEKRRGRLLGKAATKLARASSATLDLAARGKLAPDCASDLRTIFDAAGARLAPLVPSSS